MIQYPVSPVLIAKARSTGCPLEPVVGLAGGETRWRA